MDLEKIEGKCLYCAKTYSGRGISRHLESHLKKLTPVKGKKSFHLRVDAKPYFLNFLMDGNAGLVDLDQFLRGIWLECCGHLSQFSYGRWNEELGPVKANRVFDKGTELWYAYDFGSTTELDIRCVGVHPISTKEDILLLSRNEPFSILCDNCGKKPAVELCTVHYYGEEDMFFCEDCIDQHMEDCPDADYAMLPVVNSPRMGVCGYDGGMIDRERDRFAVSG
jgi:hypothetical protein